MDVVSLEDLRKSLAVRASISFDDETLRFFLHSFEGGLNAVTMDELVEDWAPFLQDGGACADESEARALCEKVVADLKSPSSQAPPAAGEPALQQRHDIRIALTPWLEQLKLTEYQAKAEQWCEEMGIEHLHQIFEKLDEFIEKLSFRSLEKKRVKKAVTESTIGGERKYIVQEFLGEGATAKVYRCTRGLEEFAVKTISLPKLRSQRDFDRTSERLQREVKILSSLQHPKIVRLIDVIEEEDNLYLIMELVGTNQLVGRDLFYKIKEKGRLRELETKHVFVQICEGLQYIHDKDVVYRDLKPENILIEKEREKDGLTFLEIKLADFGHSKLISDGYSIPLTRVGTPQYWAPEVSDAKQAAKGYGKEVDLWSLGVVVYVMLTGKYPFDGEGERIEMQIRDAKLNFRNKDISQHSKALIRSLIQVRPGDRLKIKQCLEHRWEDALSSTT